MNDMNMVGRSIEHLFSSASEMTFGFQRVNSGINISRPNKPTKKSGLIKNVAVPVTHITT